MPGEAAVERQAPVVGIVDGSPGPATGPTLGDASARLLLQPVSYLVTNRQKGSPMSDDVRAGAPSETGFGNLDEATLRALIEHVPVTVYIDRLDWTGSTIYTHPAPRATQRRP